MDKNILLSDEQIEDIHNRICSRMQESLNDVLRPIVSEIVHEEIGELLDFPLTVHQVAKLTCRSEVNIYKMCQRGKIPYTKVGTQIHINLRDINSSLIIARKPIQELA